MMRIQSVLLITAAVVLLAGCGASGVAQGTAGGSAAAAPSATTALATEPPATEVVVPTDAATEAVAAEPGATEPPAAPTAASTPAPDATASGGAAAGSAIRLALQPDSQVTYRVREQLANVKLPSDAVGTTKAVTGTLVIQPDGTILADQSEFVVDLSTLTSDSGMRDNYIRRNTLQTSQYPEAVFAPTAVEGLAAPFPTNGDVSFKLVGDLTVRGVTKQVTWDVQGNISGNDLTGTAKTNLKFGDFGMTPPQTMMALSVEDNIALEIAYHVTATQE